MSRSGSCWRGLAVVIALATLAAGCGDSDDSNGGDGSSSSADDSESSTDAADDSSDGTTVRIAFGPQPEGWEPGTGTANGYLRAAYETLVVPDFSTPELTDLVPGLAAEWEQTDDSVTFVLQDGVTFHDGEPFDADAVKANLDFARTNPGQFTQLLDAVESVDVVDPMTVRMSLSRPAPGILNDMTGNIGIMSSPKALEDGTLGAEPVGTGAWIYDPSASVTDQTWAFTRWDGYWGELPETAPDNVQFIGTPDDSARLNALKAGELDVTDLTPTFATDAEGDGMVVYDYGAIGASVIMFDRGPGGAFEDIEVRQAVCQAIDGEAFVEVSDGYLGAKTQRFEDAPYRIDDYPGPAYDPEAAKAFFGGLPEAPGATLPAISGGSGLGLVVQGMLAEAGVEVEVINLPESEYHPTWNSGEYGMGIGGESELHPYAWYAGFFAADGPYNPSGVESPELAAAADAAIAAGDSDEADELWREALQIMYDEYVMCPYFDINQFLVSNPDTVDNVLPVPYLPGSIQLRALDVS